MCQWHINYHVHPIHTVCFKIYLPGYEGQECQERFMWISWTTPQTILEVCHKCPGLSFTWPNPGPGHMWISWTTSRTILEVCHKCPGLLFTCHNPGLGHMWISWTTSWMWTTTIGGYPQWFCCNFVLSHYNIDFRIFGYHTVWFWTFWYGIVTMTCLVNSAFQ
jgi:hypothetical protein